MSRSSISTSEDSESIAHMERIIYYRNAANDKFKEGKFDEALVYYNISFKLNPKEWTLLCSRSRCYLKLNKYKESLADAREVLDVKPLNFFATYLAVHAYLGLGSYGIANNFLRSKLQEGVICNQAMTKLLNKVTDIDAQSQGRYDMVKLYLARGKNYVSDVIDYESKKISLQNCGLVVTSEIEPGELLISSQAFAAIYYQKYENRSICELSNRLLDVIVKKVKLQPEKLKQLYRLEVGYLPPSANETTEINRLRIRSIIAINAYEHRHSVDQDCYGLWILPSFIKNDCINANCAVALYGNVKQIRCAKTKIKKGDELTIAYQENGQSLDQRIFGHNRRNFQCFCEICQHELFQSLEARGDKNNALKTLNKVHWENPRSLSLAIKTLNLLLLRNDTRFNQFYLTRPLYVLGTLYYKMKDFESALRVYEAFFGVSSRCSSDFSDLLYKASARVFCVYYFRGDIKNTMSWKDTFLNHVKLRFGSASDDLVEIVGQELVPIFKILGYLPS